MLLSLSLSCTIVFVSPDSERRGRRHVACATVDDPLPFSARAPYSHVLASCFVAVPSQDTAAVWPTPRLPQYGCRRRPRRREGEGRGLLERSGGGVGGGCDCRGGGVALELAGELATLCCKDVGGTLIDMHIKISVVRPLIVALCDMLVE